MSEPSIGERLKAERERRGISTQKAADDLHLDAWVIEALEAGDYARIGPSVYAKGYLRKYASILGVSTGDVAMGADKLATGPRAPVMRVESGPGATVAPLSLIAPLLALLLVAGVAAALYYKPWRGHLFGGPAAPRAGAPAAAASPSAASAATTATAATAATSPEALAAGGAARSAEASAAGADASDAADAEEAELVARNGAAMAASEEAQGASAVRGAGPVRLPSASQGAVRMAAAAAGAPVRGAGPARLRLSFSADSWVEVLDSTGRRVYSGQGRANSVKTILGVAPLRVYLGYASGVQLELNDHVVAIGPQFLSGDVARFEAGADGVLRRAASKSAPSTVPAHAANTAPPPG